MGYNWKQLGAKIAKVGVTFLVLGGATALGGASIPTVLLAALSGEAIAQGFGEIVEGSISGITAKEMGVLERFREIIQLCVRTQLGKTNFSKKKRKALETEIIHRLFLYPMTNTFLLSMDKPETAVSCVQQAFDDCATVKNHIEFDTYQFCEELFSRISSVIDDDHEFTTLVYLQRIDNVVNETHLNTKNIQAMLINLYEKLSFQDYTSEQISIPKQVVAHGDFLTGNATKFDFGNHNQFGKLVIGKIDKCDTKADE